MTGTSSNSSTLSPNQTPPPSQPPPQMPMQTPSTDTFNFFKLLFAARFPPATGFLTPQAVQALGAYNPYSSTMAMHPMGYNYRPPWSTWSSPANALFPPNPQLPSYPIPDLTSTALNSGSYRINDRRRRTTFTNQQLAEMKALYRHNTKPDYHEVEKLSKKIGLTKNQVRNWFANQRVRSKPSKKDLTSGISDNSASNKQP